MNESPEIGQWAILELMGRKVVAGYLTKDDWQGHAMLRIDVPNTSAFPAFTQVYGPQAVYCITYVSESVAKITAEYNKVNPVSVYVPDLAKAQAAMNDNEVLRKQIQALRAKLDGAKGLPNPMDTEMGDPDTDPTRLVEEDDDYDDEDTDDNFDPECTGDEDQGQF